MTNKKEIKIEWCENWIKRLFEKYVGIEVNLFWNMAEASGLWERGTYGSPMSQALEKLVKLETVRNDDGEFLFNAFRLA